MLYSYEFKRRSIKMNRQGILIGIPVGISKNGFQHQIRYWARVEEALGPEAIYHLFWKVNKEKIYG